MTNPIDPIDLIIAAAEQIADAVTTRNEMATPMVAWLKEKQAQNLIDQALVNQAKDYAMGSAWIETRPIYIAYAHHSGQEATDALCHMIAEFVGDILTERGFLVVDKTKASVKIRNTSNVNHPTPSPSPDTATLPPTQAAHLKALMVAVHQWWQDAPTKEREILTLHMVEQGFDPVYTINAQAQQDYWAIMTSPAPTATVLQQLAAGTVTEGGACWLLGVDRATLRQMQQQATGEATDNGG